MHRQSTILARSFVAILVLSASIPAFSAPVIVSTSTYTENFGPNSAGFTTGWLYHVQATISDPLGVPANILSVTANGGASGAPNLNLPFLSIGAVNQANYESILPWPGQPGPWRWLITATNDQLEFTSTLTHILNMPALLSLAGNVQFSDQSATPTITWDSVAGADNYRIRLLNSTGDQFYQSGVITGTSFALPTGLLEAGDHVTVRIMADDLEGGPGSALENRSSTFVTFDVAQVPGPGSLALLGLGLFGLGWGRRRKG